MSKHIPNFEFEPVPQGERPNVIYYFQDGEPDTANLVAGQLADLASAIDSSCEVNASVVSRIQEYEFPIASVAGAVGYYIVKISTQEHIAESRTFDNIILQVNSSEADDPGSLVIFDVRLNHEGQVDHKTTSEGGLDYIDPEDFCLEQAIDHNSLYELLCSARRSTGDLYQSLRNEETIRKLIVNYNALITQANPSKISQTNMIPVENGLLQIETTYNTLSQITARNISMSIGDQKTAFTDLFSYTQTSNLSPTGIDTLILGTSLAHESAERALALLRITRKAMGSARLRHNIV